MQAALAWFVVFWMALGPTWGQEGSTADDVRMGHQLAVRVCAICHVAAVDQDTMPILHPPAPSFQSIAQRPDISADSLQKFMTMTHRNLDTLKGMPNPELLDFQVKQVAAYLLSLRK
jgi:mono/diheme cytochrome c family protein